MFDSGFDILLDGSLLPVVAANGEMMAAQGDVVVLQELFLRLATPLGSLFYDKEFGSRVMDYFQAEDTLGNRQGLEIEVVRRLSLDRRVEARGLRCAVVSWGTEGIVAAVDVSLVQGAQPYNLVFTTNADGVLNMVVSDVNPNQ